MDNDVLAEKIDRLADSIDKLNDEFRRYNDPEVGIFAKLLGHDHRIKALEETKKSFKWVGATLFVLVLNTARDLLLKLLS